MTEVLNSIGQSYWHVPEQHGDPLPREVDAVVVGGGVAGATVALALAQMGLEVAVLEQGDFNEGASRRNIGYLSAPWERGYVADEASLGERDARAKFADGVAALNLVLGWIGEASVDCDVRVGRRFHAAVTGEDFLALKQEGDRVSEFCPHEYENYEAFEQPESLRGAGYSGSRAITRALTIHPGKLHHHLLRQTKEAGASLHPATLAHSIDRQNGKFCVNTSAGPIFCKTPIVTTNGYSGIIFPYTQRRIIPVPANIIVTSEIDPDVMAWLMPDIESLVDTRNNFYCLRKSPDGKRLILAARTGQAFGSTKAIAKSLGTHLSGLFAEAEPFEIDYAWSGMIAVPRDQRPHAGEHDGIHYVTGCSGSGLTRHFYMGRKLAEQIIAPVTNKTFYMDAPLPSLPSLIPASIIRQAMVAYYDIQDKLKIGQKNGKY